mmetsp:Transcript_91640/g.268197  ORF Transcript_91640/g.268197 Transcript_91640/m.268197 type:complete len:100 (-) Transcript_91640:192-491(-)
MQPCFPDMAAAGPCEPRSGRSLLPHLQRLALAACDNKMDPLLAAHSPACGVDLIVHCWRCCNASLPDLTRPAVGPSRARQEVWWPSFCRQAALPLVLSQ